MAKEINDGWTIVIKRDPTIGGEFIANGRGHAEARYDTSIFGALFLRTRKEARAWLRGLQSGSFKFDARVERARVTYQTFREKAR